MHIRHHGFADTSTLQPQFIDQLPRATDFRIFEGASAARPHGLRRPPVMMALRQLAIDLGDARRLSPQDGGYNEALLKFRHIPVVMLNLAQRLLSDRAVGVDEPHAHNLIKGLRAHRARIHPNRSTEVPRNPFHPLEAAKAGISRRARDLLQSSAHPCRQKTTLHRHLIELTLRRMDHGPTNPAVSNQQIGAAADNTNRHGVRTQIPDNLRKGRHGLRLHPKLRRATNPKRGVEIHRLIEPGLAPAVGIEDFPDGLQRRQIPRDAAPHLVDVSSSQRDQQIPGPQRIADPVPRLHHRRR